FARARSGNAGTNDEIITPNHIANSHDNFTAATSTSEIVKSNVAQSVGSSRLGIEYPICTWVASPCERRGGGRGRWERQPGTSGISGAVSSICSPFPREERKR